MKVAIMQPYFAPYPGYFRLFFSVDLFVIYDCVQFPRRGFVHRNRFYDTSQHANFFALPLKKKPVDTAIKDLEFSLDAETQVKNRAQQFPILKHLFENKNDALSQQLSDCTIKPVNYIIRLLQLICHRLNIPFNILRSSELNLPASLKGQDRIIQIAQHLKAKEYINAPGGIKLYGPNTFKKNDIQLKFLKPYQEKQLSILHYLLSEDAVDIRNDIIKNIGFQT